MSKIQGQLLSNKFNPDLQRVGEQQMQVIVLLKQTFAMYGLFLTEEYKALCSQGNFLFIQLLCPVSSRVSQIPTIIRETVPDYVSPAAWIQIEQRESSSPQPDARASLSMRLYL